MCDILDNFNLPDDEASLSYIITSASNLIKRAEALQQVKKSAPPQPTSRHVQPGATVTENSLHPTLIQKLNEDLPKLDFMYTGVNQPGVCLFGTHRYVYSKATSKLEPIPFTQVPSIAAALIVLNRNMGKQFNSVLVNRYFNKNSKLDFHKDDEPEIDQTEGIASLSLGAERRFYVADSRANGDKGIFTSVTQLTENSVFVMEAGFQDSYVHKVAPGRKSIKAERGERYSLTFRRLLSPPTSNSTAVPTPTPISTAVVPLHTSISTAAVLPISTPTSAADVPVVEIASDDTEHRTENISHNNCCDTLVIGSSLTKGLDKARLSERGRKFKVICHPGAHVKTIINIVEDLSRDESFCCDCVQEIFVVVGGNDVQNGGMKSMPGILNSISTLLDVLSDNFIYSMINMFSLIPRGIKDTQHLERMYLFNEEVMYECQPHDNVKFINIFSNFLEHKKLRQGIVELNTKLYQKDLIHFSGIGNSVLAKVIIGVTYNPY